MFKKSKRPDRSVLFIDASREFEKAKNQNRLAEERINKIVETYRARQDVEKYARLATIDEIRENDYNLNIPRYKDTFEQEEEIDLAEVRRTLEQDNREIAELEEQISQTLKGWA